MSTDLNGANNNTTNVSTWQTWKNDNAKVLDTLDRWTLGRVKSLGFALFDIGNLAGGVILTTVSLPFCPFVSLGQYVTDTKYLNRFSILGTLESGLVTIGAGAALVKDVWDSIFSPAGSKQDVLEIVANKCERTYIERAVNSETEDATKELKKRARDTFKEIRRGFKEALRVKWFKQLFRGLGKSKNSSEIDENAQNASPESIKKIINEHKVTKSDNQIHSYLKNPYENSRFGKTIDSELDKNDFADTNEQPNSSITIKSGKTIYSSYSTTSSIESPNSSNGIS